MKVLEKWNVFKDWFQDANHKTFWMVIRKPMKGAGHKYNNSATRHRYYDKECAIREATRLANLTGKPFLVMKTVMRIDPTNKKELI